jgi:hypothetical protein
MDADRFATVLTELLLAKSNALTSVGRDVFRDRIESTEKVLRQIDKNLHEIETVAERAS